MQAHKTKTAEKKLLRSFFLSFGHFFYLFTWVKMSGLFHSFWDESIVRQGKNMRSMRKTTWPPSSRTWLLSLTWPELGSNPQWWDGKLFRVLKISGHGGHLLRSWSSNYGYDLEICNQWYCLPPALLSIFNRWTDWDAFEKSSTTFLFKFVQQKPPTNSKAIS